MRKVLELGKHQAPPCHKNKEQGTITATTKSPLYTQTRTHTSRSNQALNAAFA